MREADTGTRPALRAIFVWTCWVPLASFAVTRLYVDRFEGWGQWAAAPILLFPVLLSALFLGAGALLALHQARVGAVPGSTWSALALASGPALWLVWRLLVTA